MKQKHSLNKGFIYQQVDKEIVIFDSERSELYTFNETAGYIFLCLRKGNSEKKIVDNLMKKYDVSNTTAKKDIKEVIRKLKKKKVIT